MPTNGDDDILLVDTSVAVSATRAAELLTELADRGIAGGAVYDALVAAAAGEHGLPLLTRDRRALDTYRELKVDARLVE